MTTVQERAKAALAASTEVKVPVAEIRPYPGQPRERFSVEAIQRLAESIRAGGQATPGLIRPHPDGTGYQLIDGERRWRAFHLIPEGERPLYRASLVEVDDEGAQFLLAGIANLNREGHTALEAMRAIERLRGLGIVMAEIAGLFGKSEFWCYQMQSLRNLVPEVQRMLDPDRPREEQIPVTAAIQIAKAPRDLQLGLARRVLRREVSTVEIRGEVVKATERTGREVRTRERSPKDRWDSMTTRVRNASTGLVGAAELAGSEDLVRIIRAHGPETDKTLSQLRRARAAIDDLEAALRRARA